LREFAERKGEKLGYFSIEVSECRPFYVGGLVNHPGAYAYVGGMTVLHAVALAGGIYRAPNAVAADALKEKSRLADALERLKELFARRARLEAERDDKPTVSLPDELLQLDPIRAGKLIELERNLLRGLRDVTSRDKDGLESFALLTNTEADTYQASITSITQRIGEQASLFGELRRLYNQKLINHQRYFEAVTSLDTAERDRNLAVAGLAHAKASIEKTKRDVAMLTLANKARVSKEIAEAEQEIARLKTVVLETRALIEQLQMLPGGGAAGPAVTYRVMRRDENGTALFVRADETSLLSPDDVVQVELLPNEERMKLN
jgi:polysaccharide export outer membrane protein